MTTRKQLHATLAALSDPASSPEAVGDAARWLQKEGAVSVAREQLEKRIAGGAADELTKLLLVEFTLRDVEGLGDAERLNATKGLLEREKDSSGRLPPAFAGLGQVWDKQDALYQAEQVFSRADKGSGADLMRLAKRLKNHSVFADARRLFREAKLAADLNPANRLKALQQQALCTYKDPTMPRAQRFDDAIALLEPALEANPSAETLGLTGAIYKRKWEIGNRVADLQKARHFYLAGHKESESHVPTRPADPAQGEDPKKRYRNWDWDAGYTGINAAFVTDKLAGQVPDDAEADRLREQARALRASIVKALRGFYEDSEVAEKSKTDWWLLVTLVEAALGLALWPRPSAEELAARFEPAQRWIKEARALAGTKAWEFRSTVTQLVELTRVLGVEVQQKGDPLAERTRALLESFLGQKSGSLDAVLRGKVGLALSGGGFRAAFYHIGVLAKLAELDVLRHVEVISCVSGGSIIGAHYYLELRKWLQEHEDHQVLDASGEIDRKHYVSIVKRVEQAFLKGVQDNLRTRVATNPKTAIRTLLKPTYSRTERLGELYDKHLFRRVEDGEGHRPRMLDELLVEPKGENPMGFVAPRDNWLRLTPAPVLILNATTLNTGHNWQFTATWMGESRWSIDDRIDGNARLRRPYYWQAPEPYRKFPLGRAVAASSCVPGLFEPILLPNLYPGYAVRLVDGGVHDNQGVAGLLEQDCSWLIVSDASGQMTTEPRIDGGSLKSFSRMSNIQMARIREEQLKSVRAMLDDYRIRGAVTVHLREGLSVEPVNWVGYEGDRSPPRAHGHAMKDLRKDVLEPLSAIRTDLDSFNDTEALALMAAGYKMIEARSGEFAQSALASAPARTPRWDFLDLVPPMTDKKNKGHQDLKRLLGAGAALSWKIWRLEPVASLLRLALVLLLSTAALAGAAWLVNHLKPGLWTTIGALWPWALIVTASLVVVLFAAKLISNKLTLGRCFARHALSSTAFSLLLLLLWPLAWLHLLVFDRRYLTRGGHAD